MNRTGMWVAAGLAMLVGPGATAWAGPATGSASPMHAGEDHGGGDSGDAHPGEGHGDGGHGADHDANPRSRGDEQVAQGDFYPMGDAAPNAFGYAKLARFEGGTEGRLHVGGLHPDTHYESHLHEGTCSSHGAHYRHDEDGPAGPPNEMWFSSDEADPRAGLTTNDHGVANGSARADWKARNGARSVMVHDGASGHMVACADLS